METNTTQTQPNFQSSSAPVGQLKTNRSLIAYILLGIITLGIYPIVMMSSISNDINIMASRYDGRRTMHYCLLFFLVSPITCGIGYLVWQHKICERIGSELQRRNIAYSFNSSTYWLWGFLGTFIIVGPFIFMYKMFNAMNMLAENYNHAG